MTVLPEVCLLKVGVDLSKRGDKETFFIGILSFVVTPML